MSLWTLCFSPLNPSACWRNEELNNHAWINVRVTTGRALFQAFSGSFLCTPNYWWGFSTPRWHCIFAVTLRGGWRLSKARSVSSQKRAFLHTFFSDRLPRRSGQSLLSKWSFLRCKIIFCCGCAPTAAGAKVLDCCAQVGFRGSQAFHVLARGKPCAQMRSSRSTCAFCPHTCKESMFSVRTRGDYLLLPRVLIKGAEVLPAPTVVP